MSERWPERAEVDEAWRAVISGARSREDVHDWTVPWVEGQLDVGPPDDLMVGNGLQYLHGLDLVGSGTHGLRQYLFNDEEAAARYQAWTLRCLEYDLDPAGWSQRQVAKARQRVAEERDQTSD